MMQMQEQKQLVDLLLQKKYHITTAESCTGGMVASAIVDVSGASNVFEEGYITYSNAVKEKLLHVSEKSIEQWTEVSEQVACEMAYGACKASGAEVSVAVTGYAGPEGGADGTPAGTVYIGTCINGKAKAKYYLFQGSREDVRRQAAAEAIRYVMERITQE